MNILCVCHGGKHDHGQDALSSGWHYNAPEPIGLLSRWWAQRIVLVQDWDPVFIPREATHKIRVLDVGPDRWHDCRNPELIAIVREKVGAWAEGGFA